MAEDKRIVQKKCPECDGTGYVKTRVEGMDDTHDANGRRRIIRGGYMRIA